MANVKALRTLCDRHGIRTFLRVKSATAPAASVTVAGLVHFLIVFLARLKIDLQALTIAESMMRSPFGWLMLIGHHNQNGGK
jgi:hypothetical protein